MKRGRPSLRQTVRTRVSHVLRQTPYPVTVRTIQKSMTKPYMRPAHWCTIKKYLDELAEEGIVIRQVLPAAPKRKPLVVYFLRQAGSASGEDF